MIYFCFQPSKKEQILNSIGSLNFLTMQARV